MREGASPGRRGFLVGAARWALALLLGGGVGAMVVRERDECTNRGVCRGCAVFDTCKLPEAAEARSAQSSRYSDGR